MKRIKQSTKCFIIIEYYSKCYNNILLCRYFLNIIKSYFRYISREEFLFENYNKKCSNTCEWINYNY